MTDTFKECIADMQTLDLQVLQSFYGDLSEAEVKDVLQRFYQEASQYHQRLTQALVMQNVLEVIRVSHSLKSMAAISGAQQYSTLCLWIERMMREDELEEIAVLASYLPTLWQQLEYCIQRKIGPEPKGAR